jgi:hypothetical protein
MLSTLLFGSLPPLGGIFFLIVGFPALVIGLMIDPTLLDNRRYIKHIKYKRILTTGGFIGLMIGLILLLVSIVI